MKWGILMVDLTREEVVLKINEAYREFTCDIGSPPNELWLSKDMHKGFEKELLELKKYGTPGLVFNQDWFYMDMKVYYNKDYKFDVCWTNQTQDFINAAKEDNAKSWRAAAWLMNVKYGENKPKDLGDTGGHKLDFPLGKTEPEVLDALRIKKAVKTLQKLNLDANVKFGIPLPTIYVRLPYYKPSITPKIVATRRRRN